MAYFENVKKDFGFGFIHLPMKGGEVDKVGLSKMVNDFFADGAQSMSTASDGRAA